MQCEVDEVTGAVDGVVQGGGGAKGDSVGVRESGGECESRG